MINTYVCSSDSNCNNGFENLHFEYSICVMDFMYVRTSRSVKVMISLYIPHIRLVVYNAHARKHKCILLTAETFKKTCMFLCIELVLWSTIYSHAYPTELHRYWLCRVSDAKCLNISVTRVAKIVLKFIAIEDVWPTISTWVKYFFKKHILTRNLYTCNVPYHRGKSFSFDGRLSRETVINSFHRDMI
jgi:hypothetical protein